MFLEHQISISEIFCKVFSKVSFLTEDWSDDAENSALKSQE